MNRQKIDRIKERIEFINKDNEALKTQFTDSDGDIKAQAAEYISDNEEQVRFLQSLLDEPEQEFPDSKENQKLYDEVQKIKAEQSVQIAIASGRMPKVLQDKIEDAQYIKKLEAMQQPLDAPTHSGWWWNETYSKPDGDPVWVEIEDGKINVSYRGEYDDYLRDLEEVKQEYSGKWLPANNPFGKGE